MSATPTPDPSHQHWPSQPQWPQPQPPMSGLAIASLVLGIAWLFWLGSILAVVFGHIALKQANEGKVTGRGLAIAGLVLGWIGVGTLSLWILLIIIGAAAGA